MPRYSGITTNPARRRREHEAAKKYVHNWKLANGGHPFPSRAAAQAWEDAQIGEHEGGGATGTGSWYGYSFDYDS